MQTPTVRLTIPVSKATHDVFTRIANGSGVPIGRCMAQWLQDTLDAADYMAQKIETARQAPGILSRELHGYAAGLAVAGDAVIERAKRGKTAITPPSSNTGGKSPKTARNRK